MDTRRNRWMFGENTITTLKVDIQGKAALVVQSIDVPV